MVVGVAQRNKGFTERYGKNNRDLKVIQRVQSQFDTNDPYDSIKSRNHAGVYGTRLGLHNHYFEKQHRSVGNLKIL